MAIRLYILPLIGTGTDADPFSPKYITDGRPYTQMHYGIRDATLVAVDVTDDEHTTLASQSDVAAVPQNLDATIGDALDRVQTVLEALRIPSGWVTSMHTFRTVLRIVAGVFQFSQRMSGLTGQRIADSGVTLNTRWNSFPTALRQAITDTADDLGYDSTVQGNPQLRTILRELGEAWGATSFVLGPVVF